ncbi:homeobox protein engrailed-1 [Drosophila ficusphila]|uniref:homeobox protein engrailed-1 n=1 Tax=Drosophila ficusphila TaxID=30025 RepID=UPI0007E7CCEA|nr:homeobox protein engrailed-1 [Drosophila ficusphila]
MRSLWFLLLLSLTFVGCGPGVSALRCYQCEDCDENTQLSEMEVCDGPTMSVNGPGTPATSSSSPSPSPDPAAPAPAASPSSAAPAPSSPASSDVSEEEEDYESEEPAAAATGNGNGSGGAAGGATGEVVSEEEEEEDEEEEEERRRRRSNARQVDLDVPIASCYTVRLKLNDTVITKRGCTTARMGNQTGACDGLLENWSVAGCSLCQNDGCNKPIYGSSSRNIGQSGTIVVLTLMAFIAHQLMSQP